MLYEAAVFVPRQRAKGNPPHHGTIYSDQQFRLFHKVPSAQMLGSAMLSVWPLLSASQVISKRLDLMGPAEPPTHGFVTQPFRNKLRFPPFRLPHFVLVVDLVLRTYR